MNIRDFYNGKSIFITGSSGFLGICLLEKILRTIPEHGNIYLLLRSKKGKNINERLDDIKKNQIFEKLLEKKSVENVFQKVYVINGDIGEPDLGLNMDDQQLLIDNVNIIFHSAATLDFGDTLKSTININLLGTRRMLELGRKCKNLNAFIHVSSAYVNSYLLETDEILYDLPVNPDKLIELTNKLTDEELEKQTPEILGDHPNTYTITKHMAEHEVKKMETVFPCTIVRPSMIVGAWKEPIPGWTISKNGPQGFLMGAGKGVIRRLPVGKNLIYDYIPVDIVVNQLIVSGYYVGKNNLKNLEIYHCTSSTRNPFRWSLIEDKINTFLHDYPLKSAIWYPHLKLLSSVFWFKFSAFFVHFLPAIFLDLLTKLFGGRPILVKLHRNVNSSLNRLEKFIFTEWKFNCNKTNELYNNLNKNDQQNFNININDLIWLDYFRNLTIGVRIYLHKEPLRTLSNAKIKDNILMVMNFLLQAAIISGIWYFISFFTGLSWPKSTLIVPFAYIILNFL